MEDILLFKLRDIETNIKAISKTLQKTGNVRLACVKYHDSMIALAEAINRQSSEIPTLVSMIANAKS